MSTAHLAHPTTASSGLRGWIARHPLLAFFGLAFSISWSFMLADGLGSYGLIPFRLTLNGPGLILVLLMSYGPTFAALIVSWASEGGAGIRTLFGRLLPWRAGLHWYVLVLLGPAILSFGTSKLQELLGATLRPLPAPALQLVLMSLLASIIRSIVNGEELGWRGYALPRLQERYNALTASLILGVLWFAFHVPIMFIPGSVAGSQTLDTALPFLIGVLAMSVFITWIFNSTSGSMLPIMLLHGAYNTWPELFMVIGGNPALGWLSPAISVLLAAIIVLVFGPARLSRKPATKLSLEAPRR
jgi:membrane protease YdiL (CAAX protease family)